MHLHSIARALARARLAILTMALTYLAALLIGEAIIHTGNASARGHRDGRVAQAHTNDPESIALAQGNRLNAAL